jgi:FAD:protein FMN transferase
MTPLLPLLSLLLAASAPAPAQALQSETRALMATKVTVTLSGVPAAEAPAHLEAAFGPFLQVERTMNEWREDSPLSAVNAAAGTGRYVRVDAELCEVLQLSLDAARRTHGLFDPTWAGLRGLWRFGTDAGTRPPEPAALKAACPLVDWQGVQLRHGDAACWVHLRRKGMRLGLGGVAKGWAVDRAVAALRARGLKDFLVQAGGDLYAAGRKGDSAWRVGVRDPRGPEGSYFATLEVEDAAFSTSGDYERFFLFEGQRYHHLIDPRTCRPGTRSRSATVLARTATDAEFLGKAVFLEGGETGLALAKAWGASAVLVTQDNRVLVSKELQGRLRQRAPTP